MSVSAARSLLVAPSAPHMKLDQLFTKRRGLSIAASNCLLGIASEQEHEAKHFRAIAPAKPVAFRADWKTVHYGTLSAALVRFHMAYLP